MDLGIDPLKVVKGCITFALIGVAVSVALPYVCTALQFSPDFVNSVRLTQTIPWCATFFGMLGAMQPIVIPIVDNIFNFFTGDTTKEKESRFEELAPTLAMPAKILSKAQQPQIASALQPDSPANTINQPRIIGQIGHEAEMQLHR